ncbi:MAG: hypothetical protein M1834_003806 [Cirrosporium novae-zelandiae]|nr:MAG: hypothetical protein M1834_003806 [Cirrosporium novae-zelandiae]
MVSQDNSDDSDWEYEYEDIETETFYVNLDLSTVDGPVKPARHGQPDSLPPNSFAEESNDPIQILGLDTINPIISYKSHYFDCTWADTIGTELFFVKPQTPAGPNIPIELLSVSNVKITGHSVNIIPQKPSTNQEAISTPVPPATPTYHPIIGSLKIDLPKDATQLRKNQAHFLEQLMAVKASKGELDHVLIHSTKRSTYAPVPQVRRSRTEETMRDDLQRMRRLAMEGDEGSRAKMLELLKRLEVVETQRRTTYAALLQGSNSQAKSTSQTTPSISTSEGDTPMPDVPS